MLKRYRNIGSDVSYTFQNHEQFRFKLAIAFKFAMSRVDLLVKMIKLNNNDKCKQRTSKLNGYENLKIMITRNFSFLLKVNANTQCI